MLDLAEFDGNLDNVMKKAEEAGVKQFLCVSVTLEDHAALLDIANRYPQVDISIGVHPNEHAGMGIDMADLYQKAQHARVVAIGETGLDYFRSEGELAWQQDRFRGHIDIAKQLQKPLIIHTRAAKKDTIDIMRAEKADQARGVMHCFTEDWTMAKQALDLDFYISFSGIVTFNSAKELQEVAKKVPLERFLIETDCPYLAPTPHRGKMNQPAYVKHVAEFIAQLRGMTFEEVAKISTENYYALFGHTSKA
tara:strand:- start:223719 stop:224471 length:753 start_codon:yes stop_codon:yes gene_type:complete